MWLFALFDLPVETTRDKREYTRFRKQLLRQGFTMLQYSVYARYCPSEDSSVFHRQRIKKSLPAKGQVRVMSLTDKQFGKMECYVGEKRVTAEKKPVQLSFF